MPFLAVQTGVYMMVPVLLRKQFAATEWQTTLATSAIPIMCMLAIFWNEVYQRLRTPSYLLLVLVMSVMPLGGIALCTQPSTVLVLVLVSAAGMGGINSLYADLLRSCYPPAARNRVFGFVKFVEQLTIMSTAFIVGTWLDNDHGAYRIYFPASVVVIGIGLWLLHRISSERLFQERLRVQPTATLFASLRGAYHSMARIFREDEDFRRFETAYCIYGLGWMICYALLPFVVVDVLHLTYGEVAWSTQVATQMILLLMLVPASYLMDRLGPIHLSAWCFLTLVIYPIGLILAWDAWSLMTVSILYGVSMAGVNLSWTLGPVSLARSASMAPQYLAIHATLTSVRAILGQFPAVALYAWTRSIYLPLAIAAAMFLTGAVLMVRLERFRRLDAARRLPATLRLAPAETKVA